MCARLRDALSKRASREAPGNRDGWALRTADQIGVSLTAFNNWYYGFNFPNGVAWECLCMLLPGLREEVMGEITGEFGSGPDLSAELAAAEALVEALKAKQAPKLPIGDTCGVPIVGTVKS